MHILHILLLFKQGAVFMQVFLKKCLRAYIWHLFFSIVCGIWDNSLHKCGHVVASWQCADFVFSGLFTYWMTICLLLSPMHAITPDTEGPVLLGTTFKHTQIARFMGPTWDPPGADRTQVGPMLATLTLLYGYTNITRYRGAIAVGDSFQTALHICKNNAWQMV